MHNLKTVYQFELKRTLKKKTFWITTLAMPIMLMLAASIVYFSNKTTDSLINDLEKQSFSIEYTDESGLISEKLINELGATKTDNKQAAIARVQNGELDAYLYYPKDLSDSNPEAYGQDAGIFENSKYSAVAQSLLKQSAIGNVSPALTKILSGNVSINSTTYKDGQPYNALQEMIAPAIFVLLFYLVIAFFGNQMLTSTTEEKENRVIEMLLTTIRSTTLIMGKILSLLTLVVIQIIVILVPVITAYVLFGDALKLPNLDLANLPLDPVRISIGAALFVSSLLLFTGLLVALGAAAPTAKEAGGFFGAIMLFIFAPLYAVTLFVSAPGSLLVQILSFFPLTAPIPLMIRNAIGNLSPIESVIGISVLTIAAVIVFAAAVRLFRFGALEYSRKLSLGELFKRKA